MTTSPRPMQHSCHTHCLTPYRFTKHTAAAQAVLRCISCLYVALQRVPRLHFATPPGYQDNPVAGVQQQEIEP